MNLVTVKSSHSQADLVVLKSRLEAEGIECVMKNELTAQVINYVPAFVVELQVYEDNVSRAREIMAETGDSIQNGRKVICPECGSEKIKLKLSMVKRVKLYSAIFLALFLFSNVPWDKAFKTPQLRCGQCDHEFYS